MNNKKSLFLAIFILFMGILITAGSYAFWAWQSNTNKNLTFNVASNLKNYIEYDSGDSTFSGNFQVSDTYLDGIHSTISIKKKPEATSIAMVATINMDVNSIGTNMAKSSALKWVVTVGNASNPGQVLSQGNFIGAKNGDTLLLLPNIEVTTSVKEYTIWIWLDVNEHPSDALSGETLDTVVWTQIEQLEGMEEIYEITKISANYQRINATVVDNKNVVTKYAVTTSNSTPTNWTDIPSNEQNNIYNLEYDTSATGTYYVWFMDSASRTTSASIEVTSLDTTAPNCTFDTFNPIQIANDETATITLTCTDAESTIEVYNLTKTNITTSSSVINVTNVRKEQVTNGYKYTITVTGTENDGEATITLPANTIRNGMSLGNAITTSPSIMVANQYTVKYTSATSACVLNPTTYANKLATYGTPYSIANPSCTGYTFSGWTSSSGLDTANAKYGESTATMAWTNAASAVKGTTQTYFKDLAIRSTKEVTLVANFTANSYTVTASANGGSITATSGWTGTGSSATKSVTFAASYGTLPTVSRTGYTFKGWYTAASDGTKIETTTIVSATSNHALYAHWADDTPPTVTISGGTAGKQTSQQFTITCSDGVGVTGTYWGTTTASSGTTFTAVTSATSITASGNATAATTYYAACKDAAGNIGSASVVVRSYTVLTELLNLNGTKGIYTNGNYTNVNGANNPTYYIKTGTALAAASICTEPTGGTLVGYKSGIPNSTNASPLTAATTTTTINSNMNFGCWYDRLEYTVTVNSGANGQVTAKAVTQGTSVVVGSGSSGTLTVRYGDTVKGTASANTGYSFSEWTGGYISGSSSPTTGTTIIENKTITGSFIGNIYIATFYYNSNATAGSTTVASTTASCQVTSGSNCNVTIPDAVRNSVGTWNNNYAGLSSSTGNMTASVLSSTTTITLTENISRYAIYSSPVTLYRPNSTTECTYDTLYRNQWFSSNNGMYGSVLAWTSTGTSNITTSEIQMVSGYTFYQIRTVASTSGGSGYDSVTFYSAINTATTIFYVVEKGNIAITNTYYYQSNPTAGSTTIASITASSNASQNLYCSTSTTAATMTFNVNVPIPEEVRNSVGTWNNAYYGLNPNTGMVSNPVSASSTYISRNSDGTYYTVYRGDVTIVYPTNTTECYRASSYNRYQWFISASSMSDTIITSCQTNGSGCTTMDGNPYHLMNYPIRNNYGTSPGSYEITFHSLSEVANSTETLVYQVLYKSASVTFKYSSDASGTVASTTANVNEYVVCTSTVTSGSYTNASIIQGSLPTINHTTPYGTSFIGWGSWNSMAVTSISFSNDSSVSYHAIYQNASVTNYYYDTNYTSRTLYRNSFMKSTGSTVYTTVLSTTTGGTTDYSTAVGPGSASWIGLATSATTTVAYSTVASAAKSNATNLYTIYQFNVTYAKGSNVASIGATSGSCQLTTSNTTCNVTLPTITVNTGYTPVGWSTTSGATTGTSAGSAYSIGSTGVTLYANATDNAPTATISGGTAVKQTTQAFTTTCSDAVGVVGYYWGTTAASTGTTFTTVATAASWSGTGNATAATTYYLGCKDTGGNITNASVVVRSYVVHNMLLNLNGIKGTYTTDNYTRSGATATYYIKTGTTMVSSSICTQPTGASTWLGLNVGTPGTTVGPPLTDSTVTLNNNVTIGCWYNRLEYAVTVSKTTNGSVKAETVTQTSNSAIATPSASATLTVRYGDTVKGTATPNEGYAFARWSSYLTGSSTPASGAAISSSTTITAIFTDNVLSHYSNDSPTSNFLSTTIPKNQVKSVTFANSIGTHTANGTDCWDVGATKNGAVLAWAASVDGGYNITIGGVGQVNANQDSSSLFDNLTNVISITGMNNFNTSNVTNMQGMFYEARNLTTLDVSNWDTSKVTTMRSMFVNLRRITTLNVSNWNTSNVTNMQFVFYYMNNITTLDVSNWNTSKVTDMVGMFKGTNKLATLNVSNWNTSNVTRMEGMFTGAGITALNVSNWNTSKVTTMYQMFVATNNLTTLDVGNWNTSNVTNMSSMFYNSNITTLDVSNWNTSKVTTLDYMFYNATKLTTLNVSNWNTSNVTKMESMFSEARNLTTLNISNWNTSKVTYMVSMFNNMTNLTTIYAGTGWNTANVTNSDNMFTGDTKIRGGMGTTYDASHLDKEYAKVDGGTENPGYFYGTGSYTITITAGAGISSVSLAGWTNTGTSSMTKSLVYGSTLDLSTITPTYVSGYTGTAYVKSGSGLLSGTTYTVGPGSGSITINATGLVNPSNVTVSGTTTKIYGASSTTLTCNTTTTYAAGIDKYYSFGYAETSGGSITNWTEFSTTSTVTVGAEEYLGDRYYSCRMYVTDNTNTTSSVTSSASLMRINNAALTFDLQGGTADETDSCGEELFVNPSYIRKGTQYIYKGIRDINPDSTTLDYDDPTCPIPDASKPGYTPVGLYTAASGGNMVIDYQTWIIKTNVANWTDASGNFIRTTDGTLYVQYRDASPTATITGGSAGKQTSQSFTTTCSDALGVVGYYWGTTAASTGTTFTSITTATSWSGTNAATAATTYYFACKDTGGNIAATSVIVRSYTVYNMLLNLNGTKGTYTTANYTLAGSTSTYYIKTGTAIAAASICTQPTGASTVLGYKLGAPSATNASPLTAVATTTTVGVNRTFGCWYNRNEYTVTVSKPTNGSIKAETVTQTSNSATATPSASATLTVRYGDTVKGTAIPNTGYSFSEWNGGYISGSSSPTTGTAVTANKTITGSFADTVPPSLGLSGGTYGKQTSISFTITCSDVGGVIGTYWGTTAASEGTTFTAVSSATSYSSSTVSVSTASTYYYACKDTVGNISSSSVVVNSYTVHNMFLNINGTKGTYTTTNYTRSGNILTYYVKSGVSFAAASICTAPTGASTISGYKLGAPSTTNASPLTASATKTTISSNVTFGCWYDRYEYNVTVSKPTNGSIKAETVTQTSNSVIATTAASTLKVRYGDTVKATAIPNAIYTFTEWTGGYISGSSSPTTGTAVTAAKTITGTFAVGTLEVASNYNSDSNFLSTTIKRNQIETIAISNSISGHTANGTNCWDVGATKNGTVLAWATDNDNDGLYEITIGRAGGVIANTNSKNLFGGINNITTITGTQNLNTSYTDNMSYMFYNDNNLTTLDLNSWNTTNVTNMAQMFNNANNLTTLNVSNWNTSNVTNMNSTFAKVKLSTLNVNKWNTINVTNMACMFCDGGVTTLNLNNWNVSNVTDMSFMFQEMLNLTALNISNWNPANVIYMRQMFYKNNITTVNINNWNPINPINMRYMFAHMDNLTTVNINWNTTNVTDMSGMFLNDSKLTTLNINNWNVSNVTNMEQMFQFTTNITTLNLNNWNTSKVIYMGSMFSRMYNLTTLNIKNWNTINATSMGAMFAGDQKLTTIDISNWNTSNVISMSMMFESMPNLTTLNLGNWNTINVTSMGWMFANAVNLTTLNVSNWNTSNVTDMNSMFDNVSKLTTLNLKTWTTPKVTNMYDMFYNMVNLTTIYVASNWNTANVTNSRMMFYRDTKLKGGSGTTYNNNYVDKTYARLDGGQSSPGYFTSAGAKGVNGGGTDNQVLKSASKPTVNINSTYNDLSECNYNCSTSCLSSDKGYVCPSYSCDSGVLSGTQCYDLK